MNKFIERMKIDNKKLSEILKEENLVLRKDKLVEIAAPITVSTLFHVNDGFSRTIMSDIESPCKYEPTDDMHFIYNGEVCEELYTYVFDSIKHGAFTIGICTSDPKEYSLLKEDYKTLRENLDNLGLGERVKVIDKEYGDHKAYLLTYRKK